MELNYNDNYVRFNTELYICLKNKMNMTCARPSPFKYSEVYMH